MAIFIRKIFPRLFFRLFYLSNPPWDSGITPPELEEFIATHPPGRAIDLGCGTGTNAITLAGHGWQVRGVDFVPKAIRKGQRKARQTGLQVDLQIGDVTDNRFFEGEYDLILDIGCFHTLSAEQRRSYRENLSRHLAADGTYLLYAFIAEDSGSSRVSSQDLAAFEEILTLSRREDGFDHGVRTSAWFWYRKKT
jgi:cyclopropane fatty-acyl-phospholipid synthase-like methyltransferase